MEVCYRTKRGCNGEIQETQVGCEMYNIEVEEENKVKVEKDDIQKHLEKQYFLSVVKSIRKCNVLPKKNNICKIKN